MRLRSHLSSLSFTLLALLSAPIHRAHAETPADGEDSTGEDGKGEDDEAAGTPTAEPSTDTDADVEVTATVAHTERARTQEERRDAAAVTEVVGAEAMARSGDRDAATAMRRVTGVTVLGGRYVYIRGLGDRYSATTFDGFNLPSTEPERRVFPLDLVPTALLDSVRVQKSWTPDLPGEFGGGVVQLRSRSVPDRFLFGLSVGGGYRFQTTGAMGLAGAQGPTDALGIDGGFRALPADVAAASEEGAIDQRDLFSEGGYTPKELEQFGESMANRWALQERRLPPDLALGLHVGHGVRKGGNALGFVLAGSWNTQWQHLAWHRRFLSLGAGGELEPGHEYDIRSTTRTVRGGAGLQVSARLGTWHEFGFGTWLTRVTGDEARTYGGYNRDLDSDLRVSRLRWEERMVLQQRVHGHHTFPAARGMELSWRYAWGLATRDEPDTREHRYDLDAGTGSWLLSDRPEGNSRLFSDLDGRTQALGVDVTFPFRGPSGEPAKLQAGAAADWGRREVTTRRYKFLSQGALSRDPGVRAASIEEVFTPETISPDGFVFSEVTRPTDHYQASSDRYAGYVMVDLPLHRRFSLVGGVRIEGGTQRVETSELFTATEEPVVAELRGVDPLPSVSALWRPREDMVVRAGYARTLSRPDFRELSPATFDDITGGRQTFGNPELQQASIHHLDLRWEWYPNGEEGLSVGGFWKRFLHPIEEVIVISAQHSVSWQNADLADSVGAEVEGRKDFSFLHPALARLSVGANVSIVWSRVQLGEAGLHTAAQRPLQGQSPFAINADLGWDDDRRGTSIHLLWNVAGRRIAEVGALGAPDTWEEPVPSLDLTFRQRLGKGFGLSIDGRNLLHAAARRTEDGTEVERIQRGFSVGLGLSWRAEDAGG